MRRRTLMVALAVAALAFPLPGCGMLEKANEIRKDVKKELGVDANVGVNVTNGVKTVTVSLSSTPKGDAADVKAKVESIVKRHVPDVDHVKVSM